MRRSRSSVTYRLRIQGQLVQVQLASGIYRGMERRAAQAGKTVEEVICDELAPLVPERPHRGRV